MIGPGHMGWGGWFWGALIMLLFWGLVMALTVLVIRAIARPGRRDEGDRYYGGRGSSSLELLKERYARGEISREEYLNMKRDLEE
jgi:putative membrane protein